MINQNMLKYVSVMSTAIGVGATILQAWVSDQKMNNTIEKKVAEEISKRMGI